MDENEVAGVESGTARCRGRRDAPHPPLELVLARREVTTCPLCGRRFRRAERRDTIDPAVWPKND